MAEEEKAPEQDIRVSPEVPKRPLSMSEAENVIMHMASKTDEQLQAEAERNADEHALKDRPMTFRSSIEFLEYVLSLMERFPEYKLETLLLTMRLVHIKMRMSNTESYIRIAKELAKELKQEVLPHEVRMAEIRAIGIAKDVIQQVRENCLPLVGGIGDFAGTRFNRPGLKEEPGRIIQPS